MIKDPSYFSPTADDRSSSRLSGLTKEEIKQREAKIFEGTPGHRRNLSLKHELWSLRPAVSREVRRADRGMCARVDDNVKCLTMHRRLIGPTDQQTYVETPPWLPYLPRRHASSRLVLYLRCMAVEVEGRGASRIRKKCHRQARRTEERDRR
jgi:hypothetical protein